MQVARVISVLDFVIADPRTLFSLICHKYHNNAGYLLLMLNETALLSMILLPGSADNPVLCPSKILVPCEEPCLT